MTHAPNTKYVYLGELKRTWEVCRDNGLHSYDFVMNPKYEKAMSDSIKSPKQSNDYYDDEGVYDYNDVRLNLRSTVFISINDLGLLHNSTEQR
jgi:hypothetical protein